VKKRFTENSTKGTALIIAAELVAVLAVFAAAGCDLLGSDPEFKVEWVEGDYTLISAGSTVDCGEVEIGVGMQCNFEITNVGKKNFVIKNINVNSDGFILNSVPDPSFDPGQTKSFTVNFNPEGFFHYTGEVGIEIENAEGLAFSITGSGVGGDLNAPTELSAAPLTTTSVRLSWTDESDNETGFKIERADEFGDGWAVVGTTAAGVTTYDDTGLTEDKKYSYKVMATNISGDSDPTDTIWARPVLVLAPPAWILGTWDDDAPVVHTWTFSADNVVYTLTGFGTWNMKDLNDGYKSSTGWAGYFDTVIPATEYIVTEDTPSGGGIFKFVQQTADTAWFYVNDAYTDTLTKQ
jgi:hypothetical protein